MTELVPTPARRSSRSPIQEGSAPLELSTDGQMTAVADGGSGAVSVGSVTSSRVRLIAGDSKTGLSVRLAAVTG